MNEFFNWHDVSILWHHNWLWFLLAFALGVWVGWRSSEPANLGRAE